MDGINQRIFQGDSTMSLSKMRLTWPDFIETLEKKNVIDTEVASDGVQVKIEAIQAQGPRGKVCRQQEGRRGFPG